MVPLPRYVRQVTKASGTQYCYFEKHRGTDQAWPRISLPEPMSPNFVKRTDQCMRMEKGDLNSLRYVDVTDRRHDLPHPDDADAFWAAVDKAEEIGKKLAAGERKTFSALIVEYKDSAAYAKVSANTKSYYKRHLNIIDETWGDDPVASLTPVDAQKAIDSYKETPAAGEQFRSTLSRLIGWGISRGYSRDNVVEYTEKLGSDGTYDPWPPWAFELFFEAGRVALHLPVYSALFTGQRSSDVVKMRVPAPIATEVPLIAQKTGKQIPVQIHSEYRRIIDAAYQPDDKVVPLYAERPLLHLREDGEPWTYPGLKTAWQREMDREEFKSFRDNRFVFHGLRKNAVCMLLEVGCSEAQVSAIVGMTLEMVVHYAKQVSQFRLARGAMKQLEENWAAIRSSVLGQVKSVK